MTFTMYEIVLRHPIDPLSLVYPMERGETYGIWATVTEFERAKTGDVLAVFRGVDQTTTPWTRLVLNVYRDTIITPQLETGLRLAKALVGVDAVYLDGEKVEGWA